jgi:hypothetical protein
MGENPTTTNRGDFTYYHDFAKALQTDAGTQQCEGSLSDCIHKTQAEPDCAIYAPLIPHGISSENPKLLSRISKSIASDLKKSAMMMEQEGSHDPASATNVPCVLVVLFLNKAYKQLQEKVEAFKKPFEEHNLLSRVNCMQLSGADNLACHFCLCHSQRTLSISISLRTAHHQKTGLVIYLYDGTQILTSMSFNKRSMTCW